MKNILALFVLLLSGAVGRAQVSASINSPNANVTIYGVASAASATATGIITTLQGLSNCNITGGYYLSPFAGSCVLVTGGTSTIAPAAYSNTATYSQYQLVTQNNIVYQYSNSTSSSGNAPPNTTYWTPFSDAAGAASTAQSAAQIYSSNPANETAGTFSPGVLLPSGQLTGSTLASGVTSSSLTSAAGGTFGTSAYQAAPASITGVRCSTGAASTDAACTNAQLIANGVLPQVAAPALTLQSLHYFTEGSGTTVNDYSTVNSAGAPTGSFPYTFLSGSNAPTWTPGVGLCILCTGSANTPHQGTTSTIQNWKYVGIYFSVAPDPQTTGIGTGGVPTSLAPTIFGAPAFGGAGVHILGSNYPAGIGNNLAFTGTLMRASNSTLYTIASQPIAGFHFLQVWNDGSLDHVAYDGVEQGYGTQGNSSASIALSSGGYSLGYGNGSDTLAFRGTILEDETSLSVPTAQQIQQRYAVVSQLMPVIHPNLPQYPLANSTCVGRTLLGVGDSQTASYEATAVWFSSTYLPTTLSYPCVVDAGIGGMSAFDMGQMWNLRYPQYVNPGTTTTLIWGGTNAHGETAQQIANEIALAVSKAIKVGRVIIGTQISATARDAAKDALNPLIRAQWRSWATPGPNYDLWDIGASTLLGPDAAYTTNPNCYNADQLHLTGMVVTTCGSINGTATSGYGVVAATLTNHINSLDGATDLNPTVTTATTYALTNADNVVLATPTLAATYTLPDIQTRVAPIKFIFAATAVGGTVAALSGQSIATGSSALIAPASANGPTVAVFQPQCTAGSAATCASAPAWQWVRTQ